MDHRAHTETINLAHDHACDRKGKYLTCCLEQELFEMPICEVVQIVSMKERDEVPCATDYVKGVVHVRGNIIPVIDMRFRFEQAQKIYDKRTCIKIASIDGVELGIIVDEAIAIVSIAERISLHLCVLGRIQIRLIFWA